MFADDGILAPLDRIATAAGVGNATLYRNFPTRDDLLAAIMTDSTHRLLDESREMERSLTSDAALREWLYRLAWELRSWHDLPSCVADAIDDRDHRRLAARGGLLDRLGQDLLDVGGGQRFLRGHRIGRRLRRRARRRRRGRVPAAPAAGREQEGDGGEKSYGTRGYSHLSALIDAAA